MWLSTDADPANAVQITQESQWRGVRAYGDEDESNSGPVFLEKGKPYFIGTSLLIRLFNIFIVFLSFLGLVKLKSL